MNKVLYLSYDGLTDPLGQSQILPYLLGLSEKGFDISIVSFEKKIQYERESSKVRALIQEKLNWTPLTYHKSPPIVSTVYDLWKLWNTASALNRLNKFSIVHCRSYITSLVGLRMKRKFGIKFIFDMRGFWADERVEGGLWNLRNPIFRIVYNYFKRKEKEFLQDADQVISLTENAKNEILSWQIGVAPITVIPTCVDTNLFNPSNINGADQQRLRVKLGIQADQYVLLYLGSWGTWYLTQEMLDFFSELKDQQPNAKFLIVTPDKVELGSFALKHDVIITRSSREFVPLHISIATASVVFIKPSFSKKASSATKLAEIMAMNVPVITNGGWGDVEDILERCRGLVIERSQFTGGLLSRQPDITSDVLDNYSLSSGISSYHKVYESLTVKHKGSA